MKTIKYLGGIHALAQGEEDIYLGSDGATTVNLSVGEDTNVSDEKAAQVADDFPGCFEIDGKTAGKRRKLALVPEPGDEAEQKSEDHENDGDPEPETAADEIEPSGDGDPEPETAVDDAAGETEPSDDDLAGQLMAHTRADLNAAAKKLKIKDPDKLQNKAAVVDAIVAKKAETAANE